MGHGDLQKKLAPTAVPFFEGMGILEVVAGGNFTAVLAASCEVFTFGKNEVCWLWFTVLFL